MEFCDSCLACNCFESLSMDSVCKTDLDLESVSLLLLILSLSLSDLDKVSNFLIIRDGVRDDFLLEPDSPSA